jgi:hypothetical protein
MTGYMNEIVFSRVLGYEDIEQGSYWCDSTQCWICQKWNKVELKYHAGDDQAIFAQKVYQVDNMHQVINRCIFEGTKNAISQMRKERKEMLALPEPDNVEVINYPDDESIIFEVDEEFEKTMKQKTGEFKATAFGFGNEALAKVDVKRTTMEIQKPSMMAEV